MQIKKPAGGAAIADRFKLDAPTKGAAKQTGTVNKTAAGVALIIALVALAVAGILTYTIHEHFAFLQSSLQGA